jgi:SAM-dependent methyltransferase
MTAERDTKPMTTDEAILHLRADPQYAQLIRDSYLEEDTRACVERFASSAEFAAVRALVRAKLEGGSVLDLGAGTGLASYALAQAGAARVYALEPDPSAVVGRGAIERLGLGPNVELLEAAGEEIPLPDGALDLVYARQVLHHITDLTRLMRECARVLKRGGLLLATREPVADDDEQLRTFLAEHPVHQLAGGEHAYRLDEYTGAIAGGGLRLRRVFGPYDTIINAFPEVQTQEELELLPRRTLEQRLGRLGALASALPGVKRVVRARLNRYPLPGRLYSFLAERA